MYGIGWRRVAEVSFQGWEANPPRANCLPGHAGAGVSRRSLQTGAVGWIRHWRRRVPVAAPAAMDHGSSTLTRTEGERAGSSVAWTVSAYDANSCGPDDAFLMLCASSIANGSRKPV